jgi:hypothetical protein
MYILVTGDAGYIGRANYWDFGSEIFTKCAWILGGDKQKNPNVYNTNKYL